MLLSDEGIKKRLDEGSLVIEPFDLKQLQSASVDLTLGRNFLKIKDHLTTHLSYIKASEYVQLAAKGNIVIAPHSFVLASTNEHIKIPSDLAALVEGRSSVGRLGLFIQNAGLVTPGFKGQLTLELYNANNLPLVLDTNMRICQLLFLTLSSVTKKPYGGKYQNQTNVTGSRLFQEAKASGGLNHTPDTHKDAADYSFKDNLDKKPVDSLNLANSTSDLLIASDHAGFDLKQKIIKLLEAKNINFKDLGSYDAQKSVDYPLYGAKVGQMISESKAKRGILICGSGIGMSIAANRFKNVRAALCFDEEAVLKARQHNNANVLVLGSRMLEHAKVPLMLDVWLNSEFEAGRHKRRVEQIENINHKNN